MPSNGIATPEQSFEGLENKAWIYGHSRWQGAPGLLYALQDIAIGDLLFIDGFDRQTGAQVSNRRFVVQGIYLTDKDSGGRLVTGDNAAAPTVLLQTSVRENGANKPWIFNRGKLLAKASNLVEGDLDDPCKYLLLFVVARSG